MRTNRPAMGRSRLTHFLTDHWLGAGKWAAIKAVRKRERGRLGRVILNKQTLKQAQHLTAVESSKRFENRAGPIGLLWSSLWSYKLGPIFGDASRHPAGSLTGSFLNCNFDWNTHTGLLWERNKKWILAHFSFYPFPQSLFYLFANQTRQKPLLLSFYFLPLHLISIAIRRVLAA